MGNSSRSSSNGSVRNEVNNGQEEQPLMTQGSGGEGSNSPPNAKRRTKASRACDHCRKRKIKCDYSEERGICTSCSKNGEKCSFERVPLKRGPTKGYAKGHSRTQSVSSQQDEGDMPSPPSRPGSVLLPPLAQYLPQPGSVSGPKAPSTSAASAATAGGAGGMGQQQQFWKVPYHEFQNQRRGSIDSMQSDLSMGKSVNENILYTTASGSQNLPSPTVVSATGGNGNGDSNAAYWSFVRNSGSMIAPEEFEEIRRKSSSFPPIFRHSSSASGQQQTPAVLYPYSQFTQQQSHQSQQPQGKPGLNPSMSSFGQFGANGFESRQGSIVSENMSPSAPAIYQNVTMTPSTSQGPKNTAPTAQTQSKAQPQRSASRAESVDSEGAATGKASKRRKRSVSQKRTKRADSSGSKTSETSSIRPPSCDSIRAPDRNGIIYGQISDVDLIDTYYEFIHVGFPIIPLNKKTLTNEILLVNTQPISGIHEINNYVILWFRNSLELLVRISLKRRYNQFFQSLRNDSGNHHESKGNDVDMDSNSKKNDSRDQEVNENDESLEVKSVFISALNECLQKIVDIHPKFRENKGQISPKIKVIYLSTFVLLNYILAFVGYDNSFVIGMSVTIFKEFKVYEQLVWSDIEDDNKNDMSIIFKRLYVLLIILDSLQVCCYGGPQLLNFSIQGCTEKLFETHGKETKWNIDDDPIQTKCILQSLKLGELINSLVKNRRSVCDLNGQELKWEPGVPRNFVHQVNGNEPVTIMQLFHDFLLIKNVLTNSLLSLKDLKTGKFQELTITSNTELTGSVCDLISLTLKILTLIMKLNPNNRIDYNYRPQTPINNDSSDKDTNPLNETISQPEISINRNGTDFYQKLLGLQQNKDTGMSEAMKGVISPYCVSILHEIQNTNELIRQIPTLLIGVVMTVSNRSPTAGQEDFAKPQELVVELSNSMNEVVQITSLLNMIKPLRMFDQDASSESSWRYLTGGGTHYEKSIMERLYYNRAQPIETGQAPTDPADTAEQNNILEAFVKIGWKLLDDKELGWF